MLDFQLTWIFKVNLSDSVARALLTPIHIGTIKSSASVKDVEERI
jgi:hypothetical protein